MLADTIARMRKFAAVGCLGLVTVALIRSAHAQEVDLETFCQNYPLNSRCQDYPAATSAESPDQTPDVIAFRLPASGPNNEWIRLDVDGSVIRVRHTTRVLNPVTQVFSLALGPVNPIRFHNWRDHDTTQVTFVPDQCSQSSNLSSEQPENSSCVITGSDSITLPDGLSVYQGEFTVEYLEEGLVRTISFRVPTEN